MAKVAKSGKVKRRRGSATGEISRGVPPEKTEAWRREYYIPDYSIQRAAQDLAMNSDHDQTEIFAGRMFAIQDIINDEDLDKIEIIERESDNPFFLEIVKAARKEALTGDLELRPVDSR
ncbi:MAG: hypothetical protein ACREDR_08915 [Blastocatellia bacterium]